MALVRGDPRDTGATTNPIRSPTPRSRSSKLSDPYLTRVRIEVADQKPVRRRPAFIPTHTVHRDGVPQSDPRPCNVPDMLTAKDLESLLKIDVKTIYAYVRQGLIPYVRIQSNIRFDKREILNWIEKRTFVPR